MLLKNKMAEKDLKNQISQSINIKRDHLNEISIEDIKFSSNAQLCISKIVVELMSLCYPNKISEILAAPPDHGIPCRGYWIESTIDLVLHISLENYSKTIVVPSDSWGIRDDIIIN
jgi:hypothetical protein